VGFDATCGAYGDRGVVVEPAGEDSHAAEDDPFVLGQQVMGPVNGGFQGLLARQGGARRAGEQGEALVETGGDLGRREDRHSGGRQFYGQRNAVQASTDISHRRRVGVGQSETWSYPAGPVDEQLDRLTSSQPADSGRIGIGLVVMVRDGEGGDPPGDLAGKIKGLAAGGQDAQRPARRDQPIGKGGGCLQDVLAVVQDE
jgi:hypothetical protein